MYYSPPLAHLGHPNVRGRRRDALVCPTGSRKLVVKEDNPELPEGMLQDYNLKASYRFRNGVVHV